MTIKNKKMKKRLCSIVMMLALCSAMPAVAQVSHGGEPMFNHSAQKVVAPDVELPTIDNEHYLAEDMKAVRGAGPMRMGVMQNMEIDVAKAASKTASRNGVCYQLSVTSPGAKFISVSFGRYNLPDGASLFLYDATGDFVLGQFFGSDAQDGLFYTQAIPGEVAYIEVQSPRELQAGELVVNQVCHGYKDIFGSMQSQYEQQADALKGPHGSAEGSCHINVKCPDADDWRDQIRSVVALEIHDTYYSYMCSGALLNNTSQDKTPYVLTAFHCQELDYTLTRWVAYFLYETSQCNNYSGVSNKSVIGATIKAKFSYQTGSDFCLLKLNNSIPDSYTPYYAGWDRNDVANVGTGVCIHHPGGDFKKISFARVITRASLPFYRVYWYLGSNNKGVTEQGSSGSPLFNEDKRVIGQLYAGSSACDYMSGYDEYGRFYRSWNGNNTSTGRLSDWLDPLNTGVTTLDGLNYDAEPVAINSPEDNEQSIKVFPNPTSGVVHFDVNALGDANYKVFDLGGRCVKEGRTVLTSTLQAVDLTTLPAGTYVLQLHTSSRSYSANVVISK